MCKNFRLLCQHESRPEYALPGPRVGQVAVAVDAVDAVAAVAGGGLVHSAGTPVI